MGVDFLKSKCPEFAKGWDSDRLKSVNSQLFADGAELIAADVVFKTIGAHSLREGEEVLVRAEGDRLCILSALAPAAILVQPNATAVSKIHETGGYARGRIAAAYPTLDLVKVHIR